MGELTSIREIARRLVEEYRHRGMRHPIVEAPTPAVLAVLCKSVEEPILDGMDREFLRTMGIEA